MVDKLAESKPMRRAAQITAYTIIKAQDTAKKVIDTNTVEKFRELAQKDLRPVKTVARYVVQSGTTKLILQMIQKFMRK
jgi:hypothetical protein